MKGHLAAFKVDVSPVQRGCLGLPHSCHTEKFYEGGTCLRIDGNGCRSDCPDDFFERLNCQTLAFDQARLLGLDFDQIER
jgi:hypothetical protein